MAQTATTTRTVTIDAPEQAEVVRLPTQQKRAAFVRKQLRKQGKTVQDLADESGRAWQTVQRYADLSPTLHATKNPATNTFVSIMNALGYDVVVSKTKGKKRGTVSI